MDGLGINLGGLITQIVSFLVLFVILRALLYKPLLKMIDLRSIRIKDSLEAVEASKQEAAKSQEEMQRQIDEAQEKSRSMIEQAREVSSRFREEELAKARKEIDEERERAQTDIQRERDTAIEELRTEFAGLAMKAAEKVVSKALDDSTHRDIIEDVLYESSKMKQG